MTQEPTTGPWINWKWFFNKGIFWSEFFGDGNYKQYYFISIGPIHYIWKVEGNRFNK